MHLKGDRCGKIHISVLNCNEMIASNIKGDIRRGNNSLSPQNVNF